MPTFLHVVRLDTVGGVETLYTKFLEYALSQGEIHHTCVSGKSPHKSFSTLFDNLQHKPYLEKYLWKFRIPRIFRSLIDLRRGIIQELVSPATWIFWNSIEEKAPPQPAIYYEHGASWTDSPTTQKRSFLHGCSSFLANSKAAAIILKEKWGITSPIHVIDNPLRPDITIASTPRVFSGKTPLRLGFMGRLVPIKGLTVALHVVKQLVDKGIETKLSIAGVGPDMVVGQKVCKYLDIEKYVYWNGLVENVSEFLDDIDILLIPSIREPLGLVALEAAAKGIPVVATKVDGLPEVVIGACVPATIDLAHGKEYISSKKGFPDVVVNPDTKMLESPKIVDPDLFTEAILKLVNSSNEYRALSEQAICCAKARSNFTTYCTSLYTHFH